MKIGQAVLKLKKGEKMKRKNWPKEKGFIALRSGFTKEKLNIPYIYLQAECGHVEPWICSHTDLLAEDWTGANK